MTRRNNSLAQRVTRFALPLTFLFAAAGLQASTFTYTASSTSSPACSASNPCSGTAIFDITGTDTFTVTLDNTVSNIDNAGQLLTDLMFNLAGGTVTLSGSNGSFINISNTGTVSAAGSGSLGWGFGNTGGSTYILCIICGSSGVSASGAQPAQGIIDSQANYSTAGGSIAGNPAHNPFVVSGATFDFTTSVALNPNSSTSPFSNINLSFGTAGDFEVPAGGGTPSGGQTPEPVSMMLTGAGLIGLAIATRRRKAQA